MKSSILYQGKHHKWVVFGRDPAKSEKIIDTNQYLIVNEKESVLLDPGGIELFSPMLAGGKIELVGPDVHGAGKPVRSPVASSCSS